MNYYTSGSDYLATPHFFTLRSPHPRHRLFQTSQSNCRNFSCSSINAETAVETRLRPPPLYDHLVILTTIFRPKHKKHWSFSYFEDPVDKTISLYTTRILWANSGRINGRSWGCTLSFELGGLMDLVTVKS